MIDWLNNKLINKSEVARQIGIAAILFRMKQKNINRNRFSSNELKKLEDVRTRFYNSLSRKKQLKTKQNEKRTRRKTM